MAAQKSRRIVGRIHSIGEINFYSGRRLSGVMLTIELHWGLMGRHKGLFRADGNMGRLVSFYTTGSNVAINATPTDEKLHGIDIYDIVDIEQR